MYFENPKNWLSFSPIPKESGLVVGLSHSYNSWNSSSI